MSIWRSTRNLLVERGDVPIDVVQEQRVCVTPERTTSDRGPYEREEHFAAALASLDAEAWRLLFEENYQRVYGYAYVRLGNAADADDIAAGVFVEAVRGIPGFRYRGIPVAAWLFRIASNQIADAVRRRMAAPKFVTVDAVRTVESASHPEMAPDLYDLGAALGRVKPEHRDVIALRFVEGRSVKETAKILRKSEGAVKLLQLRALRAVRRKLEG